MELLPAVLVLLSASLRPGELRFIDASSKSQISPGTLSPDTCSQCIQIMKITTENGPNNDTQEVVHENLNHLCGRLPMSEQDECKSRVEIYLPKIPQMKPDDVCKALGHCAVNSVLEGVTPAQVIPQREVSTPVFNPDASTQKRPTNTEYESVEFSPQCTLCLFLVRKMENMLPKNRTEEAVVKLMGQVCDLLPHSYRGKCNDFINKYGQQMVDFFMSTAAPHSICALLHVCLLKEAPRVEMPPPSSDCKSCRRLLVLGRLQLGLNFSRPAQTSAFLESVCLSHPHDIPNCELFLEHFGLKLQGVLANQMDAMDPCERAELCVAVNDLTYYCNLGATYWCKDLQTALMCGNVPFCKKHLWP